MRDWNPDPLPQNIGKAIAFSAYLWGIETGQGVPGEWKSGCVFSIPMRDWNLGFPAGVLSGWTRFSAYLWGIETRCGGESHTGRSKFSAYLWGIETQSCKYSFKSSSVGFQHTYEGLKHEFLTGDWSFGGGVFSIPMRDWNMVENTHWHMCTMFSAYLWGIETPTSKYCIPLHVPVFSIPMRDWNSVVFFAVPHPLPFSAYLWGIETITKPSRFKRSDWFSAYLWGIETSLTQ